MNSVFKPLILLQIFLILGLSSRIAAGQDAQSEAGEPRANAAPTAADPAAASAKPPAPVKAAPPPATTRPTSAAVRPSQSVPGRSTAGATDRVNLSTATVTGDRDQPKVMYIVPWKKSDIGDLSGKPMNSLLDEALAPVDRDEFRREVAYFDAVKSTSSQNGTPKPSANQGEK
jgi:hypothetical protein